MLKSRRNFSILVALAGILWNQRNLVECQAEKQRLIHEPRFLAQGQTFRVIRGDSVVLPCQADHLGPYTLIWKRANAVLSAGEMKITLDPRLHLVNGLNLEIQNVRTSDGGDYICQLSTNPPQELVHTLEIMVPPKVHVEPKGHITITKGDTVTLRCKGSGNPSPTLTWTRRNNLLPNGKQSVDESAFTISEADRHHGGTYVCSASNGVGTPVESEIQVVVQYPPQLEVERAWVHSGVGHEAILVCFVHADPPVTKVKWYQETMLLETDGRRLIQPSSGSRHSLIIRKVQPSDFGNYSCEADNSLGRSRQHIELSGRPSRAVFRSDTIGRMRNTFNMTWSVDSYYPVEEHKLSYRKKHFNATNEHPGRWHDIVLPAQIGHYYKSSFQSSSSNSGGGHHLQSNAFTSPTQWKSYILKDLEPGVMYEAKVQSRNKYGWADASQLFQFSTSLKDFHPYESSPQHDVYSGEPQVRDMRVTAFSSSVSHTSLRPSDIMSSFISWIINSLVSITLSSTPYYVTTHF